MPWVTEGKVSNEAGTAHSRLLSLKWIWVVKLSSNSLKFNGSVFAVTMERSFANLQQFHYVGAGQHWHELWFILIVYQIRGVRFMYGRLLRDYPSSQRFFHLI